MDTNSEHKSVEATDYKWLSRIYGHTSGPLIFFAVMTELEVVRMPDVLFGILIASSIGLWVISGVYAVKYGKATGKWLWF